MTIERLAVAAEVAGIVRPAWATVDPVVVVDREARMDEPLARAAAAMKTATEAADITAAVRSMYKRVGLDPTKTRPSSEALLRRVRKGDPLPRINSLVDVINWTSLETQLSFGLYDLAKLTPPLTLRLGTPGESYPGIRKDDVHLEGRLTLSDATGPFGNPTSDSARSMVTTPTTSALVVVFVPASLAASVGERAIALTRQRISEFCVQR